MEENVDTSNPFQENGSIFYENDEIAAEVLACMFTEELVDSNSRSAHDGSVLWQSANVDR